MDRSTQIRKLRGLRTQAEFAAELGVRRQTVAAWESGESISMQNARQLVEMGLDPELFLPVARPTKDARGAA